MQVARNQRNVLIGTARAAHSPADAGPITVANCELSGSERLHEEQNISHDQDHESERCYTLVVVSEIICGGTP